MKSLPLLPVSASQIDIFLDCERKWAWQKLEGLRTPPNAAAQLGTDVHAVLEKYLKTGQLSTDGREGQIAEAGIKHLPKPGTVNIEEAFVFETSVGLYRGYMDAHWVENGVSYVLDHKTTSDFKWVKTEEVLQTDTQANIYAVAAMFNDNTDEVVQRWVYYLTGGKPRSKKIEIVQTRDAVEPLFEDIELTVARMRDITHAKKRALELEPSPHACMKYGGCPFIGNCNLTEKEITRSVFMQMSLAEKLKMKHAQSAATETPKPAINPPLSAPAKMDLGRIRAAAGVAQTIPAPAAEQPEPQQTRAAPAAVSEPSASVVVPRRDMFAAYALQGLIARGHFTNLSSPEGVDALVNLSWELADEMIKAGR